MTNSKTGDGEHVRSDESELKRRSDGTSVRFYRGPMSLEQVNERKKIYEAVGWKVDSEEPTLWFVSPCGRWFHGFNRDNSSFTCLDGEWVKNLVVEIKGEEGNELGIV